MRGEPSTKSIVSNRVQFLAVKYRVSEASSSPLFPPYYDSETPITQNGMVWCSGPVWGFPSLASSLTPLPGRGTTPQDRRRESYTRVIDADKRDSGRVL